MEPRSDRCNARGRRRPTGGEGAARSWAAVDLAEGAPGRLRIRLGVGAGRERQAPGGGVMPPEISAQIASRLNPCRAGARGADAGSSLQSNPTPVIRRAFPLRSIDRRCARRRPRLAAEGRGRAWSRFRSQVRKIGRR